MYQLATRKPDWFSSLQTVEHTTDHAGHPIITGEQIQAMRDDGEDESFLQQEWYCSFDGAQQGSYYGKGMRRAQSEGRIRALPFDERYLVYVYADIGHADHTVLGLVQFVGEMIHWIDCVAETEQDLPYFAQVLNERARTTGYCYGGFIWPPDMKVVEWGSGEQRLKKARTLGLNPSSVAPKHTLQDGIDAVRSLFSRFVFDERRTESLRAALWSYHKEYDEEHKVFRNTPVHDWASHYCDMVRMLAMSRRPLYHRAATQRRPPEAPVARYTHDPLAVQAPAPGGLWHG